MEYSHSFPDEEFEEIDEFDGFEEIDLSDTPKSIIIELMEDHWRFYHMKLSWRKFIEQAIDIIWDLYRTDESCHINWTDVYYFVKKIQVQIQDDWHRKSEVELLPTESFAKAWIEAQKQDISEDDFIQACLSEIPTSSYDVFVTSFCEKIDM
jgi:hypothetical protein